MMRLDPHSEDRTISGPAVDIKVYPPRVSTSPSATDADRREFEYPICRDGIFHEFRLFGHEVSSKPSDGGELQITLRIDHDWVLEDALELKSRWGIDGDGFAFLCGFSRELIGVLAQRKHVVVDARYTVLADPDLLRARGLELPDSTIYIETGQVALADIVAPSRNSEGSSA